MNVNVNANVNNSLVNLNNNLLSGAGKLNTKGSDQNSFMNLLSMMLGNANTAQPILSTNTSDADITEILTGLNIKQNISLPYESLGVTKSDILTTMGSYEEKNEINQADNISMSNVLTMMGGLQNPSYSDAKNIVSKISDNVANKIVGSSSVIDPYLNIMKGQESLNVSANNLNNQNNPLISSINFNNEPFINKLIASGKNVTNQKFNAEDADNETMAIIDSGNSKENVISKSDSLKEMMSSEINKNKEEFKNELDLSRIALADKKIVFKDNNRIIKVSDESSQIKSSVLSQLNDKIMIMVRDGSQKVKMKLFPEKLGEIDIKMSFENQKIKIEIMASNKETEKLLISHAGELTSILNKSNDSFANVVVKSSENQHSQFEQNSFTFNHQKNENQNHQNQNHQNYVFNSFAEDNDEGSLITEMINLRNLKLNTVV